MSPKTNRGYKSFGDKSKKSLSHSHLGKLVIWAPKVAQIRTNRRVFVCDIWGLWVRKISEIRGHQVQKRGSFGDKLKIRASFGESMLKSGSLFDGTLKEYYEIFSSPHLNRLLS